MQATLDNALHSLIMAYMAEVTNGKGSEGEERANLIDRLEKLQGRAALLGMMATRVARQAAAGGSRTEAALAFGVKKDAWAATNEASTFLLAFLLDRSEAEIEDTDWSIDAFPDDPHVVAAEMRKFQLTEDMYLREKRLHFLDGSGYIDYWVIPVAPMETE